MNIDNISTQLLFTTFPIWVERENGNNSFGTGFIFNYKAKDEKYIPFLITNFHVVENAKRIITEFVKSEDNKPNTKEKIKVELDSNKFLNFSNKELDISAIPIAPIINQVLQSGTNIFYRVIDNNIIPNTEQQNQFSAIEDVTFIGYPNGLYDTKNMLPIVRRGITATPIWNDFNNKRKYLIDAGVYPGSSGSPVFIFNEGSYSTGDGVSIGTRLLFVGMLSESVVRLDNNIPSYYLGLGGVLKSDAIVDFLDSVVKSLNL
jgi:hypothetical protein